jgi:hypothetical protein
VVTLSLALNIISAVAAFAAAVFWFMSAASTPPNDPFRMAFERAVRFNRYAAILAGVSATALALSLLLASNPPAVAGSQISTQPRAVSAWLWLQSTTLFPKDAAAFWAMIQAVGVLGALFYAWQQVKAFREVDRVERTVKAGDQYFEIAAVVGESVSSSSYFIASVKDWKPYVDLRDKFVAGAATPDEVQRFDKVFKQIVLVYNFWDSAYDLYSRNLLERELFMSRFGTVLEQTIAAIAPAIELVKPGALAITIAPFERMGAELSAYKKRHGGS